MVYNHIDPAVNASTHSHGTDIRGNFKIFYTNIIDHGQLVGDGKVNVGHINSGTADDGDVITADGSGGATWEEPTGGGGGGGSDSLITEDQVIDETDTTSANISGERAFQAIRRHAPDVVPARFSTIHRSVVATGSSIMNHQVEWSIGSGTLSFDFKLDEYDDLVAGFFGEMPVGTFTRFSNDTQTTTWDGAVVSKTQHATDTSRYTIRFLLTTNIGNFAVGDDMRIEFEYRHADIVDESIEVGHINSESSTDGRCNDFGRFGRRSVGGVFRWRRRHDRYLRQGRHRPSES